MKEFILNGNHFTGNEHEGIKILPNNWFLKHPVSGRAPGGNVILTSLVTGERKVIYNKEVRKIFP
jgi:hypothetical protein